MTFDKTFAWVVTANMTVELRKVRGHKLSETLESKQKKKEGGGGEVVKSKGPTPNFPCFK